MIREFQYTFQNLDIQPKDIAEFLGFDPDKNPDPIPELIESAFRESANLFPITAGYKYFEQVYIHFDNQYIFIDNQAFFPGKKIIKQLNDASSIAIFICSAGNKISDHTKKLSEKGDHLISYVFDVIGSIVVEKTKNKLINELKAVVSKSGLNISDPFSPGHNNWNISEQKSLFTLLPENFCRVRLTESMMMKPVKSVSGLIGIGKTMSAKGNKCNHCGDMNCMHRRLKRQKKN